MLQIISGKSIMHDRKREGPIIVPWRTPVLLIQSYKEFPARSTESCVLQKIRLKKTWPPIPEDLRLWRRPTCQNLSKISSTTRHPKRLGNDNSLHFCTQMRRPKSKMEIRKKTLFSKEAKEPVIYKLTKYFTNNRRKGY